MVGAVGDFTVQSMWWTKHKFPATRSGHWKGSETKRDLHGNMVPRSLLLAMLCPLCGWYGMFEQILMVSGYTTSSPQGGDFSKKGREVCKVPAAPTCGRKHLHVVAVEFRPVDISPLKSGHL